MSKKGRQVPSTHMRLSPYIISRIDWSRPYEDPVRRQFLPVASTKLPDHPQPGPRGLPTQNWKTFPSNRLGEIAAINFLTVPTVVFRTLYVFGEGHGSSHFESECTCLRRRDYRYSGHDEPSALPALTARHGSDRCRLAPDDGQLPAFGMAVRRRVHHLSHGRESGCGRRSALKSDRTRGIVHAPALDAFDGGNALGDR